MKIKLTLLFLIISFAASATDEPKYYGATFPTSFIIYLLAPDNLAGWNGALRGYEIKYIPEKYQKLPILGGWYGEGVIPDKETLLKADITKAFLLNSGTDMEKTALNTLRELNIPTEVFHAEYMSDYATLFRKLGAELNVPERGNALAAYAENSVKEIKEMLKDVPESDFKKVYFAQNTDGLATPCANTYRGEVVKLAGGVLVHTCQNAFPNIPKITFEQLMNYDPDIIFVQETGFWENFAKDSKWQHLRAVKNKRIYKIPNEPFNWLDRPPTYMRFIGVKWLACKIHPDKCLFNVEKETQKFMELFFNKKLTFEEVSSIINQ
jgi:iron complex transport system substrate-binding protein